MKRIISIWMAAAREILRKLLLLLPVMAGVEYLLLLRGFEKADFYLAEGYGSITFDFVLRETKIPLVYFLAMVAVVAICCLQGCRLSGKNVYTLQRLPLGEVPATLLWSMVHLSCFLILWAVQLVLMLWFWRLFAVRFGAVNPGLELFVACYTHPLLHGLLPLADTSRWIAIGIYLLTLAFSAGCFGFFQRRGKFRSEVFVAAAMFSLPMVRKSGMDADVICIVICCGLLAIQIAALWGVYHNEEEN